MNITPRMVGAALMTPNVHDTGSRIWRLKGCQIYFSMRNA